MAKLTRDQLDDCTKEGRFAVGQLRYEHAQEGCIIVPAGERFVVKAAKGDEVVALFPHDAKGLAPEERVFTDGHIRVVPLRLFDVVGRID